MSLAVAILMDPIDSVDIDADSTFVLALEAQARGHTLYHYLPRDMFLRDGGCSPGSARSRCGVCAATISASARPSSWISPPWTWC